MERIIKNGSGLSGSSGRKRKEDQVKEVAMPQSVLMSGNDALAQGAWEAGVRVGAGYPGTPSTEILEALARLPGVDCEWSPNEKVALEVAVGASIAGARAIATMKHVGVNVAADPFFSVAYMGVNGGLVVVSADDPGMHSSQNEQDNRLLARHARVPLLEPATPAEARCYMAAAFPLSEEFDTPVLLRSTTRLSHGTARVEPGSRTEVPLRPYRKAPAKNVVLPVHGQALHRRIEEWRIPGLAVEAEDWAEVLEAGDRDPGHVAFITAGVPALYVQEAFPGAPVLKLGMTHPLPEKSIRSFAERFGSRRLYVVEELEPFLEEQVRAMGIAVEERRWPRYGELSVPLLRAAVPLGSAEDVGTARTGPEPGSGEHAGESPLPVRPPALCPGCGHRGAFHALARAEAIVHGDIGCYTLGALPPMDTMDTCMNMGASIGMAHGMEKVLSESERKKVVSVLGDSTFYHSGVTGLMDVVYNRGSGTVVVLDNRTTAMTGHQPHPGTGSRLDGETAPRVDIGGLARAVGVDDVRVMDPYDLLAAWRVLDGAMQSDQPSVLIAADPCVLKERVVFGEPVALDPHKCTDCLACTRLGCPAIEEAEGRLRINELLCNGCSHCQQVCGNCNAGIDIPLMLELVDQDRVAEALALVLRANPMPAISSRVCPHPCEMEVNALGLAQGEIYAERHPELVHRFPGAPGRISVRAVEGFLGDWALAELDAASLAPEEERPGSVGIVGSGPAGLSAAWYLRTRGWKVKVYEAASQPGGMLRTGIPAFRLSRDILDGELDRWRAIGVEMETGVRVGSHVTLEELQAEHQVVILATGRHASRPMSLPGSEEVPGAIQHGLDFLCRFNDGEEPEVGRRVAVIGGGNTAIDCARSARRRGAAVKVIYRRTEEEMPAIPEEVQQAREEGVEFSFQRNPVRAVVENGRLKEVETIAMTQGEPDESGRRRPVPVPDSQEVEPFDTVILAIGEDPDLEWLEPAGVVEDGYVGVNIAGATARSGVMACGDAAFGHGTVTQAVATGRRAAELAAHHLDRRKG